MKTSLSLLLAGAALAGIPAASLAQGYRVEALSLNGHSDFVPTGAAGPYIVGNASTDTGVLAGIWGPGGGQVLNPPTGGSLLGVSGVNGLGHVVGTGGNGGGTRAIVWRNGTPELLPMSDADENDTLFAARGLGINNAGTIIGTADTIYGFNGVVWQGDQIRILRSLNPDAEMDRTSANAINGAGQIAGSASSGMMGDAMRAVVWNADGSVRTLINGFRSAAYGVNGLGHAVGYTETATGDAVAFVNDGTSSTLLPVLTGAMDGSAEDINDAGLIVGTSSDATTFQGIATLWQNGQAIDLNSLIGGDAADWELMGATAIGDDGTIVGFGTYRGNSTSFRLTPVPEPATFAVLGLAIAALARRRKSRG